jgi:nicotinate-nucleotide adenylyltransferase
MRLGIFGGTFNPPHLGHLLLAERAAEEAQLDRVLFIPAFSPPHKLTNGDLAPPEHRAAMVRLAIEGNQRFALSTVELDRGGVSYTIDTLKWISAEYPFDELFLLIGGDSLAEFPTWRQPEIILRLARLVVVPRPDKPFDRDAELARDAIIVNTPLIDIASTDLRSRVREGRSLRYAVLPSVEAYIREQGLYREN